MAWGGTGDRKCSMLFWLNLKYQRKSVFLLKQPDTTMKLSETQPQQFHHDGYLVIKQLVAPATCDTMLAVTHEQLRQHRSRSNLKPMSGYPGAA